MEETRNFWSVPEGGPNMPIKYRVDVIAALKEAGYNTSRIRKEKIMGEAMLQNHLRTAQLSARRFTGIRQGGSRGQVIYGNHERLLMLITVVRKSSAARKNRKRVVTVATTRPAQATPGRWYHVRRYRIAPGPYHGRNTRLGEEARRKG